MKKLFLIIASFILSIILFSSFGTSSAYADSGDYDRINYYEIKVDPNKEDGTLDMHYKLEWEVLYGTKSEPLSWIEIGIPNRYVTNLNAISDGISKISYYSDNGSYIRIDFNENHYTGDIIDIEFSFTLARMYMFSNEKVKYDFRPGYFDEIYVKNCVVLWNKEGVTNCNAPKEEGDYYRFEQPLPHGTTMDVYMTYDKSYFTYLDPKMDYSDAYMTKKDIIIMVVILSLIAAVIAIVTVCAIKSADPYMVNRGFCGRPHYLYYGYYHHPHIYYHGFDRKGAPIVNPSSQGGSGGYSNHGGGGGHCACACACACAGGGRAGCSKKDFYSAKINAEKVKEKL